MRGDAELLKVGYALEQMTGVRDRLKMYVLPRAEIQDTM